MGEYGRDGTVAERLRVQGAGAYIREADLYDRLYLELGSNSTPDPPHGGTREKPIADRYFDGVSCAAMTSRDIALGPLEIATLEKLWVHGEVDARTLHAQFERTRGISLSTVQSTLERLYRKGLVARTKVSHAYVYAPTASRESVMARIVDAALKPFRSGRRQGLLAAFVEYAASTDEAALDELERLVAERKAASGTGGRSR